jgi:hypothetical protein
VALQENLCKLTPLTGGFTNLYFENICLIERIPNLRKTIDRTTNLKTFRYRIDKTAIFIGSEGVSNYRELVLKDSLYETRRPETPIGGCILVVEKMRG